MDVVAEVVRSGFVENRHRGVVVRVDAQGTVLWSLGDPQTVIFPRSTTKLFQAVAMLRCGLPLSADLLALAMASHSGEDFQLAGVRRILALGGLTEADLQTPADPTPVQHGCSGKHAAMLLTCVTNGWPIDSYLASDHPLQVAITGVFDELTAGPGGPIAVDGCGAPAHATSIAALARGYAAVRASTDGEEGRLVEAVLAHPQFVSGSKRPELAFMTELPGALGKIGADGVFVVAPGDGTAIAVKIEDGAERPSYPVMGRALELAGFEAPVLHRRPDVLGGGRPVGALRVAF